MFDLTLWLGLPGERRVWLEQYEGVALILKNFSLYFPSIKIYVDGLTAYDGERIEVEQNLKAFWQIVYKTQSFFDAKLSNSSTNSVILQGAKGEKIAFKSLSGYDYRTKICYCTMCDMAISDVSTTALVPFIFCKLPGVAFASCENHLRIDRHNLAFENRHFIEEQYLMMDNVQGVFLYDFHIPPEHIYNLAANALEQLCIQGKLSKNLRLHRLDVPKVELYKKKYQLEKTTSLKFSLEQIAINEDFKESLKAQFNENANNKTSVSNNTMQEKLISAVFRIRNSLSYKLGQAIIFNSKSFIGYLRMPYVLSYIAALHQEELKKQSSLKLPPLESLADYKEALKMKEHLSYKLGEAFIVAYKNLWRGGVLKFVFFESKRIRKEFRERRNNEKNTD
ncbi:hypothetical protein OQH60_05730 [Campylobacter sp. MIT 21-1685]|uniref:hypothetical protein n=1 Tax=unclassified Campylobacter TaxID=2593542 RepID=UPI00224B4ED3|nr:MULTISPECIES: hypothetical protein [unclassified Campylobacter]MCX2683298.1 hypothetical protein [Campylobacter sp. MIT 21-1684]MCX2751645.1 hypothetical protein [Campylobacter sp. MIT 21-1682]MCX2807846.1 hypothetical protein [Campylobacter sp. MIT 21-1685]